MSRPERAVCRLCLEKNLDFVPQRTYIHTRLPDKDPRRVWEGGPRTKVENVLALLEQGVHTEEILQDYPDLEMDDVRACLAYARWLVANETLESIGHPFLSPEL